MSMNRINSIVRRESKGWGWWMILKQEDMDRVVGVEELRLVKVGI